MALSNSERKRMKNAGRVYNRSLGKWLTPLEIRKHHENEENVEQFMTIIGLIVTAVIFVWIFAAG